jgi:hypothetical protein
MWNTIALVAFGIIFAATILAITFYIPRPTPFQYTICRVLLALAAAAIATLLTGFLEITIPNFLRAGGALAVFAVVYFYAPAALLPHASDDSRQGDGPLESGTRIQVQQHGQRTMTIPGKGEIVWTRDMARYRRHMGRVLEVDTIFDNVPVYRLDVDDGKHEWHEQWIRRV